MKRWIIGLAAIICMMLSPEAKAQDQEIQQLVLDITKLTQFKAILQQLYNGYRTLEAGYNKVKDITSGNYSLHQVFLDGLYLVNPEIKRYRRVVDIIQDQVQLVSGYKKAFSQFRNSNVFSEAELDYFARVYSGLLNETVDNMDGLLMVITDSKLRMSVDERLERIDQIYKQMEDKLSFLKVFNRSNKVLAFQRVKEAAELDALKKIEGQK